MLIDILSVYRENHLQNKEIVSSMAMLFLSNVRNRELSDL